MAAEENLGLNCIIVSWMHFIPIFWYLWHLFCMLLWSFLALFKMGMGFGRVQCGNAEHWPGSVHQFAFQYFSHQRRWTVLHIFVPLLEVSSKVEMVFHPEMYNGTWKTCSKFHSNISMSDQNSILQTNSLMEYWVTWGNPKDLGSFPWCKDPPT